MPWYSNPWVVGIIGSVPGGFLVNWITGLILGKRENREYLQKVIGANREVVYAIRPGISEGQIPSPEVLGALINATARRYGVEITDLYTPSQIAEELTKEVMDSSFISSSQKSQYCAQLANLEKTSKKEQPDTQVNVAAKVSAARYRDQLISSMSMTLGVLTVTMTAMVSLLELLRSKGVTSSSFSLRSDKGLQSLVPVLFAFITITLTFVALYIYRQIRTREAQKEIEDRELEKQIRVRDIAKRNREMSSELLNLNLKAARIIRDRKPPSA